MMECNSNQQLVIIPDTKSTARKVGRPRKSDFKSYCIAEKKTPPIPLKAPDGLYWCKKCHRHFQKPRQFNVHICLSTESQDEVMEDLEDDSDTTADFKVSMHVHKYPWSRRKKAQTEKITAKKLDPMNNETIGLERDSLEKVAKTVSNWRDDPLYVPLFSSESEKEAFEKHLKTIDYSCVDALFDKLEMNSKVLFNKKRKLDSGIKYICITCEKVFNSLCHIRMHCLTHTDLKPFTCPKCPYRCNVKAALYTHMRTHTGNLFTCSQCIFQSTKRSHLLDHEQTHSTVPVSCKLCKNVYKNLKSLIFHVKKYHANASGKKYVKSLSSKHIIKCEICGKKFTSNSKFETHTKYLHSNNNRNLEQLSNQSSCQKELENSLNNINSSDGQILSESNVFIDEPSEVVLSKEFNELKPENSFNNSCTSFENLICDNTSVIPTSASIGSQNQQENSFEVSDVTSLQKLPLLLDCSVMLEPLDDQLVNYHQYIYKCSACSQSFSSKSVLENHEILDHSSRISSEQLQTQEVNQKMSKNAFENIDFTDTQALSSFLNCSVRIEPLDEQLVMLNNLLQQKSAQNMEIFDNVYQQSESQSILNSNTMLSKPVSVPTTPEKYPPVSNDAFSSKAILENHSSNGSSKQTETQVNQNMPKNTFQDIGTPALSSLLKCSVIIEPLDDQLVMLNNLLQQKNEQNVELFDNVYQQSESQNILNSNTMLSKTVSVPTSPEKYPPVSNDAFSSKAILENHSSNGSSKQTETQEVNQNMPKNTFQDIGTPALSSLLKCSVIIEPLDDQLVMLNNLLQQKNEQNVELFDNVYQQSESQNILNSNTMLSKTVSVPTTPEKLIQTNESISSEPILENHSSSVSSEQLKTRENLKAPENTFENMSFTETPALSSLLNCSVRIEPLNDHLVELLLSNLLQQKNNDQNVKMFDSVFQQSESRNILNSNSVLNEALSPSTNPEKLLPINNVDQFHLGNASILENCHNKLDILDECLRQSNIADPNMTKQRSTTFKMSEMSLNFSDNQLMLQSLSENSSGLSKTVLQVDSEQKSEEIKLFEKCRKAPAYVCCVCSSIFICTSTLKAHLKEHVNKNNSQTSLVEYPVNNFKSDDLTTDDSSLNNVCSVLQESSNSDVENELEKLYTSSLHKRWYLPEVSVVLENDQSLIDSFLDEFPMNDKFDDQENLPLESVIFS